MPKYTIRWTETLVWESEVEASDKQEATDKMMDDEVQQNAVVVKTIEEFKDIEVEEA